MTRHKKTCGQAVDDQLNMLGLRSMMPDNWDGKDLWARHKVLGITPFSEKTIKQNTKDIVKGILNGTIF